MSIYYQDEAVTLHLGDSLEVLRGLPDESVDCCVTSPPYFGLRDYGEEGQYGLECSPAEYVETMHSVFAEVCRVLAKDGTLWLNLGDSYSSNGGRQGVDVNARVGNTLKQSDSRTRPITSLPAKNLLGIPWRTAFALQEDGWILRNDVIWAKSNGMPESVSDRLTSKHEYVFLFAKSARYWFDVEAIKEPAVGAQAGNTPEGQRKYGSQARRDDGRRFGGNETSTLLTARDERRPGDVWTLPTQPFPSAHFACMPPTLAERAILAGCKPGGTVLDPFSGSGTTGMAAAKHGRKYVGIDLNREYLDLSLRTRLAQTALLDGDAS